MADTAIDTSSSIKTFSVPELETVKLLITILGESPLIVHKWSEKAKREMLDKMTKTARGNRDVKDPDAEYEGSLYVTDDGQYYFPTIAFKAAAVSACRGIDDIAMTQARQLFHVVGDKTILHGSEPRMREDMVRVKNGGTDIRYRGEFWPWWCQIQVEFDRKAISEPQIMNLFNLAGFNVGIGEWRPGAPKTSGAFGRFRVGSTDDVNALNAGRKNDVFNESLVT